MCFVWNDICEKAPNKQHVLHFRELIQTVMNNHQRQKSKVMESKDARLKKMGRTNAFECYHR